MSYKFIFFLIGFSFLPSFVSKASSSDIVFPYQNCNPNSLNRTKSLVSALTDKETEATHCVNCQSASLDDFHSLKFQSQPQLFIPKQCFLAMALRGNNIFPNRQYTHCKNNESNRFQRKSKLCINEDYVTLIQENFLSMSRCFDLSVKKEKEIFFLINQESSGLLNIRSRSGAKCLGQLTENYIKEINKYIKSRKWKNPLTYSEIYDEVTERCPELKEVVLQNLKKVNCKLISDPRICLFYTLFGLEQTHRQIQKNLDSKQDYMGTREFSKKDKELFKLPIKLNEMLNVRLTIDGKPVQWLFWGDLELYDALKSLKESKRVVHVLETTKTPLFEDQEDIELMFNYWSHNGGASIARRRMIGMVERFKQQLARACEASSKEKRCPLRQKIQKGKSLSSTEIISFFEEDLSKEYPATKKSRRREVAYYVRKILKTNNISFGYEENSEDTNSMLRYYKKAVEFKKENLHLSKKDAVAFQKNVSETCPRADFIDL